LNDKEIAISVFFHINHTDKADVRFGALILLDAPPAIALTGPTNNAIVAAPGNITVTATANDSDGSIAKVEFYNGTTLIGTATSAPYTIALNDVYTGNLRFPGQYSDQETGTRYNYFRDYDPQTGRYGLIKSSLPDSDRLEKTISFPLGVKLSC